MSQVNSDPPAATLVAAAAAPAAAASLLDDPQEWAAFGRQVDGAAPAEGLWDSQVVLQGMHCAACALTIEEALRAVPGVQEVQVLSLIHI